MKSRKRILLVDDSQTILNVLQKDITKEVEGVEILTAGCYKEALKLILKYDSKIDVAVIDLHLPDAEDGAMIDVVESNSINSIVLSSRLDEAAKKKIYGKEYIIDYIAKDGKKSVKTVVSAIRRQYKNHGKNVLIIDDSKLQLNNIKNVLKKMNLNVTTAISGKEAFEILTTSDKDYSLVITDYHMHDMDGLELTFKIREIYGKDELVILVMTLDDDTEVINEFLKLGANDFIFKGSSKTGLVTKVNANLDIVDLFSKIKDMANKDYLTGAFNRRFFFENGEILLNKATRKNENIALAMLDLDKFKKINDKYGHDVGDQVLCSFTNIFKKQIRKSDLMCRMGGEEFAVLLEDISLEDTNLFFEKIRKITEEIRIPLEDKDLSFTVSIGVVYGKADSMCFDDIIKMADEALYVSKENGRNQITLKSLDQL